MNFTFWYLLYWKFDIYWILLINLNPDSRLDTTAKKSLNSFPWNSNSGHSKTIWRRLSMFFFLTTILIWGICNNLRIMLEKITVVHGFMIFSLENEVKTLAGNLGLFIFKHSVHSVKSWRVFCSEIVMLIMGGGRDKWGSHLEYWQVGRLIMMMTKITLQNGGNRIWKHSAPWVLNGSFCSLFCCVAKIEKYRKITRRSLSKIHMSYDNPPERAVHVTLGNHIRWKNA